MFKSNCSIDIPTNNPACLDENNQTYTLEGGNGPTTGNCVAVEGAIGGGRCEIFGWCEAEEENETIRCVWWCMSFLCGGGGGGGE